MLPRHQPDRIRIAFDDHRLSTMFSRPGPAPTENQPETRSTQEMLPRHQPDRIRIAFDDHRLVNNAGLILPATLALHLGLPQLVDRTWAGPQAEPTPATR